MLAEKVVIPMPMKPLERDIRKKKGQLRVAAYCRVSTDQEEQQTSYQGQIEYYTNTIEKNKEWKLAGIFADEGITGTSAKKRPEFLRMIEECKKGKIDLILTKSISRFARNTLDCLSYVRLLKEYEIPIIFEKESINTMETTSEMLISFLGAFAQAESESISQNVRIGKRYAYKAGKVSFSYGNFLGYRKGADGNPEIDPNEAEVIKKIYSTYLEGYSLDIVREKLENDGHLTPKGNKHWSRETVKSILTNEKYKGDALLQKTYITDCISKKSKKNNGEIQQYYVKKSHPAIISEEVFDRVQEEIARRASKKKVSDKTKTFQGKYSSKYALTELLKCGDCGTNYRRVTWSKRGQKKVVWRCINRLEYGATYCKDSPTILEEHLHSAILKAINIASADSMRVKEILTTNIAIALETGKEQINILELNNKISRLNSEMIAKVKNGVETREERDEIEKKCAGIAMEIKKLEKIISDKEHDNRLKSISTDRLLEIFNILEKINYDVEKYDDIVVRKLIDQVKVVSEREILISFRGGIEIAQTLEGACE